MNEQIENILQQITKEKQLVETTDDASVLGKAKYKLKLLETLATSALALLHILWKIVYPFYAIFVYCAQIFWKYYSPVWNKFAFVRAGDSRKFSKIRGAVTILSSAVMVWVLYGFLFFAADVALYVATGHSNEVVYLSNAQEINSEDNIHSVQGCIDQADGKDFSCDADKSLYFRIESDFFAEVWSILNYGTFFYADYVAAPIAPGWQHCTVTSYGFRMKLFLRGFDIYPKLLSANCKQI